MTFTVGLDARATEQGFKAHYGRGTGRYAAELIRHLELLAGQKESSDIRIKTLSSADSTRSVLGKKILELLPAGRNTVESQLIFSFSLARANIDLIHFFSHGDAPVLCSVPRVITVLDLIPLRFPNLYKAKKTNLRFRFARFLENEAIRQAAGILAISECTKRDVMDFLKVEEGKIMVTPLAAGQQFCFPDLPSEERLQKQKYLRQEFGLKQDIPLLLYVGGIDPRKNISFLLSAFAEVIRHYAAPKLPQLILAGRYQEDDQYPVIAAQIAALKLQQQVVLLGFIADEKLPSLYQCADAFVFPSLYEGFGLPVLEAMACGLPVIAGNNSSIPEVAGKCAVLCSDNQLQEWAQAISNLLHDPGQKSVMSLEGAKRAQTFSWERTANLTLSAYRNFLRRIAGGVN